jgi:formylglycine-generating enzyme required for sulfatase activity
MNGNEPMKTHGIHLPGAVLLALLLVLQVDQLPAQQDIPVVRNSIQLGLVRIPAGSFMMGSPRTEAERDKTEVQHKVTISTPFYMGRHEVTQGQYVEVMKDLPDFKNRAAFNSDRGGSPAHPIENVEWQKANQFCQRLSDRAAEKRAGRSYRLPTEAEWEYACRAGTSTVFYGADTLVGEQANFNGKYPYGGAAEGPYLRKTAKVGSYKPNTFGLYDMHGNVAEWCSDFYDPGYYENSPDKDPLGPPVGVVPTNFGDFFRVARGGCWVDDGRACRSAYRYRAMPATQYRLIGFRVVCELAEDRSER